MKKALVALAVILAGVLAASEYVEFSQPTTLVLRTNSIAELAPHEHDAHKNTVDDTGHGVEIVSPTFTPAEDLWVTGFDYETVHASSTVLHHAILSSATAPRTWCSDRPDSRFFTILTQDQMNDPHVRFPAGYAVRIPAGTPLVLYGMLHNAEPPVGSGETYTNVYGKITLHVQVPTIRHPLKELTYYSPHLADDPCQPNDYGYFFAVPENVSDYRVTGATAKVHTERIVFDRPTTIKYWGGHVHGWQGGKALIVKKNGAIIQTFTTRHSDSDPYQFITPYGPADVHLKSGDTLSLEAVYDNPTDEPKIGAMGVLYIYVVNE